LPNPLGAWLSQIAATRAAETGAAIAKLNALFGWTDTAMTSLYSEADRKRLALGAGW
jgi:hypothetical protein